LRSDEKLSLNMLDLRDLTTLEGRILVHGEDENSGRSYLMLEGTDARVHYVYYTPEMKVARSDGALKINSFIRLRNLFKEGRPVLDVDELGDAESILHNKLHFRERARQLIGRGIAPRDEGWNGWLGRYQKVLADTAETLERQRLTRGAKRHKNRDLGR
jgi:hypothetical protein